MTTETRKWNGMNWCRQSTRLAIYLRDGLSCAWCGDSVENGAHLQLDHVIPFSKGGPNAPSNLVTSCERCNKSRGNRSVSVFAEAVASYLNHDATKQQIINHIQNCVRRALPRAQARSMLSRRGSVAKVLQKGITDGSPS